MKRALISVSDKTGVVDFAKGTYQTWGGGASTGGTYKKLRRGLDVVEVSGVTGFPELLTEGSKTAILPCTVEYSIGETMKTT